MVADALIYHPVVSHYNKFVATTIGRDKALRTVQYFARFLAWYLHRTNRPTSTIAPISALSKNFSLVRKALRLGKFVEHFKAAAVASDARALDPVLKYLSVGRQLGYGFYLALDSVVYWDAIGVRRFEGARRLQREAYRAWLVGLSFNIVAGVYTLWNMRQAAKRVEGEGDAEKAVEGKRLQMERKATQLQLLSDLCDSTVPSSALGLSNFDDGFVGLAGTVSSLIGLSAAWAKTA